jgi:hypothetical protein
MPYRRVSALAIWRGFINTEKKPGRILSGVARFGDRWGDRPWMISFCFNYQCQPKLLIWQGHMEAAIANFLIPLTS